jgi:hypothetical protein
MKARLMVGDGIAAKAAWPHRCGFLNGCPSHALSERDTTEQAGSLSLTLHRARRFVWNKSSSASCSLTLLRRAIR